MNPDLQAVQNALGVLRAGCAAAETALEALAAQDYSRENGRLRETVARLESRLKASQEETATLRLKIERLAENFKREMLAKRIALLGLSEKRQAAYLADGLAREKARIALLEAELRPAMAKISAALGELDEEERWPLAAELAALDDRARSLAEAAQARRAAAWAEETARRRAALGQLQAEPLDEAAFSAARSFFQWEAFWGVKIVSVVGMLLIVLGVFAFGRWVEHSLSAEFKSAAIFALGVLLAAAGEVFYRRQWRGGFALALTAGGSGVLFLAVALGHMTLGVLPLVPALALCAGVSLWSFVAAWRHDARLVAIFALLGGYMPLYVLKPGLLFYGAFYFLILDLSILTLATLKNWPGTRLFGFLAGLLAEIFLLLSPGPGPLEIFGLTFAAAYIAYAVIPSLAAKITKNEAAFQIMNAAARFPIWLWQFRALYQESPRLAAGLDDRLWPVPVFFAVVSAVMARLGERGRFRPAEESDRLEKSFFVLSVVFSSLIVRYALEREDYVLGWLLEAAGLAVYGFLKNSPRFLRAGAIVGALGLAAFAIFNAPGYREPGFVWRYLAATLAATAAALFRPRTAASAGLNFFRVAAAFNLWGFAVYLGRHTFRPALESFFGGAADRAAALLSIALAFAFGLPQLRRLEGFRGAVPALGLTGLLWLWNFNAGAQGLTSGDSPPELILSALYVAVNLAAAVWVGQALSLMVQQGTFPESWRPLALTGYILAATTQNLVVQLSLEPQSLLLSLLFGLTALGLVLFGFLKRNGECRASGLVLSFVAVGKLFVMDLPGLAAGWRIISYFTGGLVLLAIAFAYQFFSRRLAAANPDILGAE